MSSTAYQLTWSQASHPANSAKDFGDRHNIHGWVLPFRGRPIDPLDFLERLGEYLDERPPYCQRVSHDVIDSELNPEGKMWWNSDLAEMAMLTHGWWLGGETGRSRYYCNPEYCHRHPYTDVAQSGEERRVLLQKAASLGSVNPEDLAPAFGYIPDGSEPGSSVTKASKRVGFKWSDNRDRGMVMMARTWKTLNHWGISQRQIGRSFDINQSNISRRIRKVSDYEPPDDPTPEVAQ